MDHNNAGSQDHAPATVKIDQGQPAADIEGQSADLKGQTDEHSHHCQCCKCSLCPFKGHGPVQLSLHMKAVHGEATVGTRPWYDGTVYKCGLCPKKFRDEDAIKFHLRRGHKKRVQGPFTNDVFK